MKNNFLMTLSLFFCYFSYSQQEIVFKVQYQPEMVYTQTMISTSKSEITYLGPDSILKKIKENNIENPTSTFNKTYLKSKNKTGKLVNNTIPICIEFIGGDNGIIPDSTMVYGNIINGGMPTLDSIVAPKMDEDFKESFFSSMKSTISQIIMPERRMKIGESFSREMPLKIPIGNNFMYLKNTINYTLIKIENNKAYFDIKQNYAINSNSSGVEMNAEGSGNGQIIYDIENTFYLSYELKSTINMEVNDKEMQFKGTTQNTVSQTNSISKNN